LARKTFISYKYSEAKSLRDEIIDKLGDDSRYYNGETSDSPDLTDDATETIKGKLKDMMVDTSVTIVIVSPNMTESDWIDWEIEYTLSEYQRKGKTSKTNGVVGVVMEVNGDCSWLFTNKKNSDGCSSRTIDSSKLFDIIKSNRYNQEPKVYSCDKCKTVNALTGSYFSLISQKKFLDNPTKYIENAYDKSQNKDSYDITKIRNR